MIAHPSTVPRFVISSPAPLFYLGVRIAFAMTMPKVCLLRRRLFPLTGGHSETLPLLL